MIQVSYGVGLFVGGPLGGELAGGEVAVGGAGPVPLAVDAPVLDVNPGFAQAVEPPAVSE